ncbi:hypothetical protein ICHIJ1_14370 [Fluviibacter phosphoraccumulans]|nr:hypothetical protein ICHIJ1_14370 [Fluviibacter phosphoraccumulans]
MPWMLLAGPGLAIQGFDAHPFHEASNPITANVPIPLSVELVTQLPGTHEWMFQMQVVYATHQIKIFWADRPRQVIHASPAEAGQLGLLRNR